MTVVACSPAAEASRAILRETFEGPAGPSTYYIDNDPKGGLFATLDGLSAAEASRPSGRGGATIAGHAFHVGFHVEVSAAELSGDKEPRDWRRSWAVTAVDEAGWTDLRSRLRRQYEDLVRAIEAAPSESRDALATAIGAVAHAAYHLGAIRQRIAAA